MRAVSEQWEGWTITASRFDSGAELGLRAERDGRTIRFSHRYSRVLDAGNWRDPTPEEAAIIASPATSSVIRRLRGEEEAELAAERQARRAAPLGPSCVRHPNRPAEHYSQSGERICAECYAQE